MGSEYVGELVENAKLSVGEGSQRRIGVGLLEGFDDVVGGGLDGD